MGTVDTIFILHGVNTHPLNNNKLFLLLYADDIVIMSETEEGLYKGLLLGRVL